MKKVKFSSVRAAVVCAVMATAGLTGAYAQSTVTTTTSAGTVSEFSPSVITVNNGGYLGGTLSSGVVVAMKSPPTLIIELGPK